MKILHVVEPLATGILSSISQICWRLRDRHEFHVLHGIRAEMPPDFKRRFPEETHFSGWDVGREISPIKDVAALSMLRRTIKDVAPDLVHAHASKAGALARIATVFSPVPVVYSPRGYAFLRRDVPAVSRIGYWSIEWLLGRTSHLTVACGLGEYSKALRVARNVHLINNMIDFPYIQQNIRNVVSHDTFDVVMCGGIRPQKNFPLFCQIASAFVKDPNYRFMWVGGGDTGIVDPVPANIHVTGWLPHEDSVRAIAAADVFMQTSDWEGLPISVLEAMALAKPLLSRPGVGNTELVIHGVNGFLCSNIEEFVKHLRALHDDPTFRIQAGARSKDIAQRIYNPDHNSEFWNSIYKNYHLYINL